MNKAMAFRFLFLFCVVFLMMEESSGMFLSCPQPGSNSALPACNQGKSFKRGICLAARRLNCEQLLQDENVSPRVQQAAPKY